MIPRFVSLTLSMAQSRKLTSFTVMQMFGSGMGGGMGGGRGGGGGFSFQTGGGSPFGGMSGMPGGGRRGQGPPGGFPF